MAAELSDNQWELGGVVFGENCDIEHESDVTPSSYTTRDQDQPLPNADGLTMGQDFFEPGLWAFKLFTNVDTQARVHEVLEPLALAWRADAYRQRPGRATTLRYRINGRTRVIFGRPRNFTPGLGAEYFSGRIPITCDFKALSDLFFDDDEESIDVGWLEPVAGGFTAPFTVPIQVSEPAAQAPYSFTVGGPMPTPAVIDFTGPLTSNSGILIDGLPFVQFQNEVPAGVTVTVDARPWINSVYRKDDEAGIAGLLSPRTRRPKMRFAPGNHTATLIGSSPTGAGGATIRWRKAYPSV